MRSPNGSADFWNAAALTMHADINTAATRLCRSFIRAVNRENRTFQKKPAYTAADMMPTQVAPAPRRLTATNAARFRTANPGQRKSEDPIRSLIKKLFLRGTVAS